MAATLGVMFYPGEDEESQRRARACATHFLAEPLRQFHEAGHALAYEHLAQIASDAGIPLEDIDKRGRDGIATGELFKAYVALAHTDPSLTSWENATKLVMTHFQREGVSASRSSLHDIRRRYRSVTHLWAAWCIRGRTIRSDPDVGYEAQHDFEFFLAEAEMLRRWGRTWRPERAKAEPPLSAKAWHVPEGWEPPASQPGWPQAGGMPWLTVPLELLRDLRGPGRPRKRD